MTGLVDAYKDFAYQKLTVDHRSAITYDKDTASRVLGTILKCTRQYADDDELKSMDQVDEEIRAKQIPYLKFRMASKEVGSVKELFFHGLYVGKVERVDSHWIIWMSKERGVDEVPLDYEEATERGNIEAFKDELEVNGWAFDNEQEMDGFDPTKGFEIR